MDWFLSLTDFNDFMLHLLTFWALGYLHGLMFLTVRKVFQNMLP